MVYKKGHACEIKGLFKTTWKHFADDRSAKQNICIYMLSDSDTGVRHCAAIELSKIGDVHTVEPLIKALENDSNSQMRRRAAYALGEISDVRSIGPLVKALENDSKMNVRA